MKERFTDLPKLATSGVEAALASQGPFSIEDYKITKEELLARLLAPEPHRPHESPATEADVQRWRSGFGGPIRVGELILRYNPEDHHTDCDDALLEYINDPEITAAFKARVKWYS